MDRKKITFRDIERQLGIADEPRVPRESLEVWYESVRVTPIVDFGVEDVYPEYVVPEAIRRLQNDPRAGEKYDGELLVALGSIPCNYWAKNGEQSRILRGILNTLTGTDADLAADVARLSARLQ